MILYELAKMDGAILLNRTGSHIVHANVQLMPDASIESQETGTRHRTAERVAKQLGVLAISISAARDVVTVYVGGIRYIMDPIRVILSKADQALQTLERFKSRLNQVTMVLSVLEFHEAVTLFDVTSVLQRTEMVLSLSHLIERFIIELGTEGRLVQLQLREMLLNVREDRDSVLRDYLVDPTPEFIERAREELIALPSEAVDLDEQHRRHSRLFTGRELARDARSPSGIPHAPQDPPPGITRPSRPSWPAFRPSGPSPKLRCRSWPSHRGHRSRAGARHR